MTTKNLNRQFSNWDEINNGDPELYQYLDQTRHALDWAALLERRRVVILAEAGSGKSTEFKEQCRLAVARGEFGFFATVRETAERGFDAALGRTNAAAYKSWRESNKRAWIFLDSVDEAKVRDVLFQDALNVLADSIAGCESRAHIFISGRHSDWEFRRDLTTLNSTLPIPAEGDKREPIDPNELVINTIRRVKQEDPPEPEKPMVVVMLPLNHERILQFARSSDVADADVFHEAMESNNLLSFARRPLDLQWLVGHWRTNQRFGTFNEMLSLSIDQRLLEKDPLRSRQDEFSMEEARMALHRIGAALVLQRLDFIAIPDSEADLAEKSQALSLGDVLPEWKSANLAGLIVKPIFDPANAGFIRLHNDNEGAVRSFLAARWLTGLRTLNCPAKSVDELLFGDTYGIKLVKPSMRETAAWLSLHDEHIASEAIARDPWLLLTCGDPGSLPLQTRAKALSAAIKAIANDENISPLNHDSLRRFSKPDMTPYLTEEWGKHKEQAAPRELILQIIWLGRLMDCAVIAAEANFGAYADRYTQIYSTRALMAVGSKDDKARIARYLAEHSTDMAPEVFWDGVQWLFPKYFTTADLNAALQISSLRENAGGHGLLYNGKTFADRISTAADSATLLATLINILEAEFEQAGMHPLLEMLEACALRLLELSSSPIAPKLCVDAYLLLSRIHRHHRGGPGLDGDLAKALRTTSANRREVFWGTVNSASLRTELNGKTPTSLWHIQLFGIRLNLGAADIEWLMRDLDSKPDYLELISTAAMEIWRNIGSPESVLAQISGASEKRPAAKAIVEQWLAPPVAPAEDLAYQSQSRHIQEKAAKHANERDESWRKFSDDLRRDPTVLRTCIAPTAKGVDWRLFHLWHLLSQLQGNQSHYSNADLGLMVPLLGQAVVDELRLAFIGQWRQWRPTLKIDRPIGERNVTHSADHFGILGISLEAAQSPDWATKLSEEEADHAGIYSTMELNGFPMWFASFCEQQPKSAAKLLNRCLVLEWHPGPLDMRREVLDDLARSDSQTCALVAQDVMDLLESRPTSSLHILEPALQIAFKGLSERRRLKAHLMAKFGDCTSDSLRACYLSVLFAMDHEASVAMLSEAMSKLGANEQTQLAKQVLPKIFGDDWSAPLVRTEDIPSPILEKLVLLAYQTIRIHEDIVHPAGEAYSPGIRDHAESARGRAFKQLVDREGAATHAAIMRMAHRPGFPVDQRHLRRLAYDRAASDSEPAPWRSLDVISYESDYATAPMTSRDLQRVAISKLDDIQLDLIHGDFNQGITVARLEKEVAVQNWFANELKSRQGNSYSLEREPHVNDEKEPDIRLQSKASDASMPIEIKIAETWSLTELDTALTSQLKGRYLRSRNNRWGILLLVHQKPRDLGWRHPDGTFLTIQKVVTHLQAIADDIASTETDAPQMRVVLVDVSTVPT